MDNRRLYLIRVIELAITGATSLVMFYFGLSFFQSALLVAMFFAVLFLHTLLERADYWGNLRKPPTRGAVSLES